MLRSMVRPSNTVGTCSLQRSALGLVSFFVLCAGPVHAEHHGASAPASDTYNKAVMLYNKGKWAQSKEYLHQYLAEYSDTPLYVTCLYYLAYCYQQLKDTEEAIRIYHKVVDGAKGGDEFWGQMAQKRIEEISNPD